MFYAETSCIKWSIFTLLVNLFSLVIKWAELISQVWVIFPNLLYMVWDYLRNYEASGLELYEEFAYYTSL